jgi:hypothetical protein
LIGESQRDKDKLSKLDKTIEDIRKRFGRKSVCRALTRLDERLQDVEINGANITSRIL